MKKLLLLFVLIAAFAISAYALTITSSSKGHYVNAYSTVNATTGMLVVFNNTESADAVNATTASNSTDTYPANGIVASYILASSNETSPSSYGWVQVNGIATNILLKGDLTSVALPGLYIVSSDQAGYGYYSSDASNPLALGRFCSNATLLSDGNSTAYGIFE